MVLPLEIEKIIPENDPVFKLVEICEKLDYSRLKKEYVRSWRKLDPETMFIILVYAYMRRMYSSRQIEEACKTDICVVNRHDSFWVKIKSIYSTMFLSNRARGTNENTNDIFRFLFPKGIGFRFISQADVDSVVKLIVNRPGKDLGWYTLAEIFFNYSVALARQSTP